MPNQTQVSQFKNLLNLFLTCSGLNVDQTWVNNLTGNHYLSITCRLNELFEFKASTL